MIGSYSPYQVELSDRVLYLRDSKGLTFKGIADLLISEGYRSPRGFDLGSESVFSIYKKRKIRDSRLKTPPTVQLEKLEVDESI
jgi:DNA-binding transcriptional MerR regulator